MPRLHSPWPSLPVGAWAPTMETLTLWTQIVGKLRLTRTPWINHAWHVTLSVSARGLKTALIPHPAGALEAEFDFINQALVFRTTDGGVATVALEPGEIADFHRAVKTALAALGRPIAIVASPNEMAASVPFAEDHAARIFDPAAAHAFWKALVECDRVFTLFRSRFLGKVSPVHFFWGAADLAMTRFSGRPAPPHPGGVPNLPDAVAREAYSHEVSSAGFWTGGGPVEGPAFYAYAYPEPPGFRDAAVRPGAAQFESALGEFVLPYAAVVGAADPDAALLDFLQTTYEAAADLAQWNRAELEAPTGLLGRPRPIPYA